MNGKIKAAALLTVGGLAVGASGGAWAPPQRQEPPSDLVAPPDKGAVSTPETPLPDHISISGVARDFRAYNAISSPHADFERYSTGHRVELVQPTLDAEGKPVFLSQGKSVTSQFKDRLGRNINPALFDASQGDVAGVATATSAVAITNATGFSQWFRDVPGVNFSKAYTITLVRQGETGTYLFQAQDNPATQAIEGFFPVDNDGFNDTDAAFNHNYHFTFELSANFVYRRGSGQVFTFSGDDDVWVFINNRLVIDVGGVHGPISQTIDLDRIADLQEGQTYPLKFFFAERHTSGSNCRIETSLTLVPAQLPATSALAD